jgi:hypothetical protein
MSLDQHLPETLRRTAHEHTPPFPDLASIVAGGRRRKRRRDVRRVAVAGACLAMVAALPFAAGWLGQASVDPADENRPANVDQLPVGDEPAIPYCPGNGTVHGAGTPIRVGCDVLIHKAGTTLYLSRRGVEQLVGGERRVLDARHPYSWFPALSHDGRWAAWVVEREAGDKAWLLSFDLERGARAQVPWPPLNGWVAGIDDLGRAYFQDHTEGAVLVHDLRTGETFEVTGLPDHGPTSLEFVTGDGFGIYSPGEGVVLGSVTSDGRFIQQHPVDYAWGTQFSPDRSLMSYERDGQLVVGPTSGDGPVVPLRLPRHGAPVWFPTWEGSASVLVQFDPLGAPGPLGNGTDAPARGTWLLRCHTDDGSCEVALPAGWGDRMAGPVYR